MTTHIHALDGCTPTPLAAYLKALAVLRLVAEQADPTARAFWRDDGFFLATTLDRDALARFFLHDYAPTPLVDPWNGGSGFYPKDKKDGIAAIAASTAARFAAYREAIASCRALIADREQAPKNEEKAALIRDCRARLRGPAGDWLDAALVVTSSGDVRYPALLGTGGNDGRLDFCNNQMQRLVELLSPQTGAPAPHAAPLLAAALFGTPTTGLQPKKAIGQFLPGAAGGANSTAGFGGDSLINPWDFVLMLEGAVLFQVAAVRRLDAHDLPQASAPFAVRPQAGGYASASAADEGSRGEQWMPLWRAPATLAEIRALFAEGRLQLGRRRARSTLDAARAVARLGAARGVTAFERFGFIERNGQANLAVPLGRWQVEKQPHVHLLDELVPWVDRLRHKANSKGAPTSIDHDVRRIEAAMLAVCREGGRPARWAHLLAVLGQAEDALMARPKSTAELQLAPLPYLSPEWARAADDDTPELRLACALAAQDAPGDHERRIDARLGPIRAHCLPLDPRSRWPRFARTAEGLAPDRRVVWTGTDLVQDLTAIALRRVIDGRRAGARGFELRGRIYAHLGDIEQFLDGALDDARIAAMARALMAVRDDKWNPRAWHPRPPAARARVLPAYALFRLLYLPEEAVARATDRAGVHVPLDATPLRLLAAGRLYDAAQIARRRVVASLNRRPRLGRVIGTPALARRIAASLCFPVGTRDTKLLIELLCKPEETIANARADASDSAAEAGATTTH